jgi:hypothetical protein
MTVVVNASNIFYKFQEFEFQQTVHGKTEETELEQHKCFHHVPNQHPSDYICNL